MEKIKEKSKPVDYQIYVYHFLSARELIRFEGEFETVRVLRNVSLLLNGKCIKISGFPDPSRLRAYQSDVIPHGSIGRDISVIEVLPHLMMVNQGRELILYILRDSLYVGFHQNLQIGNHVLRYMHIIGTKCL